MDPPYDSDHPGPWLPRQTRQDPLPLAFDLPGAMPAIPDTALAGADDPAVGDPARWAARFAQAVAETLAGVRSPAQLAAWTTRPVHGLVERRARLATPGGPRPRLGRVHVCLPTADVVEASVAMHVAARARALAFRLEARDGRWVCTALELG